MYVAVVSVTYIIIICYGPKSAEINKAFVHI